MILHFCTFIVLKLQLAKLVYLSGFFNGTPCILLICLIAFYFVRFQLFVTGPKILTLCHNEFYLELTILLTTTISKNRVVMGILPVK